VIVNKNRYILLKKEIRLFMWFPYIHAIHTFPYINLSKQYFHARYYTYTNTSTTYWPHQV
jgi:hypothetical protein